MAEKSDFFIYKQSCNLFKLNFRPYVIKNELCNIRVTTKTVIKSYKLVLNYQVLMTRQHFKNKSTELVWLQKKLKNKQIFFFSNTSIFCACFIFHLIIVITFIYFITYSFFKWSNTYSFPYNGRGGREKIRLARSKANKLMTKHEMPQSESDNKTSYLIGWNKLCKQ